jgi:capsular polysaccharide transport system permease protein
VLKAEELKNPADPRLSGRGALHSPAAAPDPAAIQLRNDRTPIDPGGKLDLQQTYIFSPTLPQLKPKRMPRTFLSFLAFVLIPAFGLAIYLYVFASDLYVTEFRFQVTETTPVSMGGAPTGAVTTTQSAAGASLSAMLGGATMSSGSPQNFVVVDFLTSQEAVEELQKRINVTALYSRARIDWWNRFPAGGAMEDFLEYWRGVTYASYDPVTGLAIVRVKAFSAADAYLISRTLVNMAEELVNKIARRYQLDAVTFAESEVQRSQDRLETARMKLLDFRTSHGAIDPSAGAVPANVDLAKTVKGSLIQQEADLTALLQQKVDPNAPVARTMLARIAATKEQLERLEREVSKDGDGSKALAEIMSKFEKIDLDRQYAQALLLGSLQAYDQARAFAANQHLYLTPYAPPTLPQKPTYPRRALTMVLSILGLAGSWLCGLLIYRAIAGHVI